MTDPLYACAITVHCDLCPAAHRADYIVGDSDSKETRLGYARSHLRKEGWRCDGTGDFYPNHTETPQPSTEDTNMATEPPELSGANNDLVTGAADAIKPHLAPAADIELVTREAVVRVLRELSESMRSGVAKDWLDADGVDLMADEIGGGEL